MSELDNLYKTKVRTLTEQRNRLCLFQVCLDSGTQRAKTAVQSSGNVKLLVARTDIVSTLGALKSQPPELYPETNSILDFSVDQERLLKFLSEAGSVSDNSACAAKTSASGNGLTVVKSGENVTFFTITLRDSEGRALGFRENAFKANLKKGNEEKTVKVNLKGNASAIGSFKASYALPADAKGQYQLSLLLRGDHIQGSPFTVYFGVPIGKLYCTSCGRKSKGNMNYYYSNNAGNSLDNENVVEEYTAYCNNCFHKVHNASYFSGDYFQYPQVEHTRANPSKVKVCGPI